MVDVTQGGALREREVVSAAVSACLEAARAGRGGALFIVGEAGMGKTSVLEEARGWAEADMEVGFARGEQIESSLAFGMARETLGEICRLDLGFAADTSAPYYRVLRALRKRAGRPLLMALDDLHWADPDSLRMFAFLARRLSGLPVALIATMRPWPRAAGDLGADLAAGGYCVLQRLAPLSREAAGALLAERVGRNVGETVEGAAWRLCVGNPLLVGELAEAVVRGESLPELGVERGMPPTLTASLLLARFAGVGPVALDCARGAAVLGGSFHPDLAAKIAGVAETDVDAALDGLSRSGLLVSAQGTAMRFTHPLFAEALYDDLAPPLRRRLHERAFRELAERGLEAEAAAHAVRAGLVGDRSAQEVVARAGSRALAVGAMASAVELLRSAAVLAGEHPPAQVLVLLGEALTGLGLVDDALDVLSGPLSSTQICWRERYQALRARGRALLIRWSVPGSLDASMVALQEAIGLAVENDEPVLAVEPLLDRCRVVLTSEGPGAALALAQEARALAVDAEPWLRARVETVWAYVACQTGDPSGVATALERGTKVKCLDGQRSYGPEQKVNLDDTLDDVAQVAVLAEHFDLAERVTLAVQSAAEVTGATAALFNSLVIDSYLQIRFGRLREALGRLDRCDELAELCPGLLPYLHLPRAEALLWLGRLRESEATCQRAERALPGLWFDRLMLAHVRGLRLLWQGDEHAVDHFLQAEQGMTAAGIRDPCMALWASHAIDAYLRVDRDGDARRILEWLEESGRALPCRWPLAALRLGQAEFAALSGDTIAAEEHYQAALQVHSTVQLPLQRSETLLAFGRFLRRVGRPRDARAPLAEACQLAHTLGAAWLEGAAHQELQVAGGRRRRAREEQDQLTHAERRVAELAADGLTNAEIARRLFVSPNTVQTHLGHVYTKLRIGSRRELRRSDVPFQPDP